MHHAADEPQAAAVDFSRDVRPLLSQHCFACHGPDEGAAKPACDSIGPMRRSPNWKAARRPIVPGKPEASELIARITTRRRRSADAAGLERSYAERRADRRAAPLDRRRAKFDDHWSFRPIAKAEPPAVKNEAWVRNPIDRLHSGAARNAKSWRRRRKPTRRRSCDGCRST